tara:strand:+ start:265 stop:615 length:351 start_codon:yes stop_codon:yes gene_type:complete
MQINLSGQRIEITPALKARVSSKLKRLERHFEHVGRINIVLSVEKRRKKAEGTLHVCGGSLHAEAVESGMCAAIDVLTHKLDRQVKRHKEKTTAHHEKQGGLKMLENGGSLAEWRN